MKELTPTLLHELVERIEIQAPDKSSGKRTQPIDVYFNYVGLIGKLDFEKASLPETASHADAGNEWSGSLALGLAPQFSGIA